MKIFAKVTDIKESITLTVNPMYTINQVKALIEHKALVDVGQYQIIFREVLLKEGSKTLKQYGIKEKNTVLLCKRGKFPIYIYTPKGDRHFTINLGCLSTVHSVKEKIKKKTGYRSEEHNLIYRSWVLDEDDRCLVSYGIVKAATRYLIIVEPKGPELPWPIRPRFLPCVFAIARAETMGSVGRAMAAAERGDYSLLGDVFSSEANSGSIQIYVQIPYNHDCIILRADPTDTIGTVKSNKLRRFLGDATTHVLLFGNKLFEDDSSTLVNCGIKDRDLIMLCERRKLLMYVCVPAHRYGFFSIDVESVDTVHSVKAKIEERIGIHPQEQRLKYSGRLLVDGERRLLDYGIVDQGMIMEDNIFFLFNSPDESEGSRSPFKQRSSPTPYLSHQLNQEMQIIVKVANTDTFISLTVLPTDTIECLKNLLQQKLLQCQSPIDVGKYMLVFGEKPLQDGSTLCEYYIKNEDSILLCEWGDFPIYVHTFTGHIFRIYMECLDTVRRVKEKIEDKTGHPPEKQHLIHCGRELDGNERCLVGYNIVKPPTSSPRDIIILNLDGSRRMEPQMEIFVEIPTMGDCVPLNVRPTDTMDAVKAMLGHMFNKKLHVLLSGKKLLKEGSSTLQQCGIRDKESIMLCYKGTFMIDVFLVVPCITPSFTVEVECLDTIGNVKEKIHHAMEEIHHTISIPPQNRGLRYLGVWLDDDESSLVDYGIVKRDTESSRDYELLLLARNESEVPAV